MSQWAELRAEIQGTAMQFQEETGDLSLSKRPEQLCGPQSHIQWEKMAIFPGKIGRNVNQTIQLYQVRGYPFKD
jgi:hypothetical protein